MRNLFLAAAVAGMLVVTPLAISTARAGDDLEDLLERVVEVHHRGKGHLFLDRHHGSILGHRRWRGPMVIQPPVPGHPAVIIPFPGHPPVLHPPIHPHGCGCACCRGYGWTHGSMFGIYRSGNGFGWYSDGRRFGFWLRIEDD